MSLFDLTGKVALITGSSRGIGRAIATQMAGQGARVVISSRKAGPCQEVSDALNAAHGPGTAIAVPANISKKEDLRALVNRTMQEWGRIDTLVCNAASNPHYGSMLEIDDDKFRKTLDNNIISNNWLVQMVAPQMIERKDGAIVIISSVAGLKGSEVIGAYCISKAADLQLARNLACELGQHNVRVNCISPGLIKTDFARALWEDENTLSTTTSECALGRIGIPDEIAGAAVFLASAAGAFMTGQTMVIDGGHLA